MYPFSPTVSLEHTAIQLLLKGGITQSFQLYDYYLRVVTIQGWHMTYEIQVVLYTVMTHIAILKQKPYDFTTNTLKAYLHVSTQPFSSSAFMINKTHIVAQKPHR